MSTIWIVVGIIVAAPVLWFVFRMVLGLTVPPEILGRAHFEQRLKQLDIPKEKIPNAMRDEIVKRALDNAMGTGGMRALFGMGKSADWRGDLCGR